MRRQQLILRIAIFTALCALTLWALSFTYASAQDSDDEYTVAPPVVVCPHNKDPYNYIVVEVTMTNGRKFLFNEKATYDAATLDTWDALGVVQVWGTRLPYDNIIVIDARCG